MSNKLFVGGLAWATDDQGLRMAFEPHGTVLDAKVITDRDTQRSRGFGFVTFSDAGEANTAMDRMNGAELDGRTLNVNVAQERNKSSHGGGRNNHNNDYGHNRNDHGNHW